MIINAIVYGTGFILTWLIMTIYLGWGYKNNNFLWYLKISMWSFYIAIFWPLAIPIIVMNVLFY